MLENLSNILDQTCCYLFNEKKISLLCCSARDVPVKFYAAYIITLIVF